MFFFFGSIWVCILFGFDVVPDLETVNFKVLSRRDQYEIREVEVCIHFNIFFTLPLRLVANFDSVLGMFLQYVSEYKIYTYRFGECFPLVIN